MGWQAWFSVGVVIFVLGLLTVSRLAVDVVMIGGVVLLMLVGILTPQEALSGLSNEGMVTVGVLFIVGAGIIETGAVSWISDRLFGRPKSSANAVIRLMLPTAAISAFMNNTPVVAILIPAVSDWAKQNRVSVSKLMMPLSYAAILGGCCTLIGTSTNLVVDGMLVKAADQQIASAKETGIEPPSLEKLKRGMDLFDLAWVGVPAALLGITFIAATQRWLLPQRTPAMDSLADPRQYTSEMVITPDSPLDGKTIEQAGLRHLQGCYLAEIDREGAVIAAVGPDQVLRSGDRLLFVGVVESMLDLQKIRGLVPAADQVFKLTGSRANRFLVEAVVSHTCPLVNKTIRDGRFRTHYNAVVIAVARAGERLAQKVGDIVLMPGDVLLIEAPAAFLNQNRNSRDFYLVSRLENSNPPRHERALMSIWILLGMVVTVTFVETFPGTAESVGLGSMSMLKAAMIAAGLMLFTRCVTVSQARRHVDWTTLLAIAASFGIGTSLSKTGAADAIGGWMTQMAAGNAWITLAAIYAVTLIVTELVTNNAAAAIMFPFALSTANQLHANPMPFVICICVAASCGFATPIGYQTNLMVYGPGGYRFSDYLKLGVPLDILCGVVTVGLAPLVWPFF